MYFPHRKFVNKTNYYYMVKDFQLPNNTGFSTRFPFKESIFKNASHTHYIDELMGLLCVLCDGPLYVDRTAFCMMLCALLRVPPATLLNDFLLTPDSFPLRTVLSIFVTDNQLSDYNCYPIGKISPENFGNPYKLANFTKLFVDNDRLLEGVLDGRGSLVLEFVYMMVNDSFPQTFFVVVRRDTNNELQYYHSRLKGSRRLPQSFGKMGNKYQVAVNTLIAEIMIDRDFFIGAKTVVQINFYAIEKLQSYERTLLDQFDDF
jgi:hypothetical protein